MKVCRKRNNTLKVGKGKERKNILKDGKRREEGRKEIKVKKEGQKEHVFGRNKKLRQDRKSKHKNEYLDR